MATETGKRQNVVIIMTDQHRCDAVGALGAPVCRTPNLDRFAESGTVFTQAYSICALCTPARASIYTGRYPHRHRLIRNSEDRYCKTEFDAEDRLLSEDLAAHGYRSAIIGKWHCGIEKLPKDFGFEGMNVPGYGKCTLTDEYHRYLEAHGLSEGEVVIDGGGWRGNIGLCGTLQGPEEASVPYFLAEETIKTLRSYSQSEQPFVLFANFWGPHAPYFPTEPYASMYDPASIPKWGNFDETFEGKPNAHRRYRDAFVGVNAELRTWEECSKWAARYYGFATMIDKQIGRIIDEVDALGLADDTAIIFSTDHGDLLGAHGGMHDKASIMCQETYHIPFIVRLPGGQTGARLEQPITNMDLYATILDIAGVTPAAGMDSRSLVPLVDGSGDPGRAADVMCEFNGHHYHYQSRMITDGHYKYVFNAPDIDELYDLVDDPWETTNLVADPARRSILESMRERLIDYCSSSGDSVAGWARNLFSERAKTYAPYGHNYGAKRSSDAGSRKAGKEQHL